MVMRHPMAKYALFVILSIGYMGCSYTLPALVDSEPFLSYRLEMVDSNLNLVRVTGKVFGALDSKVPLRLPEKGNGRGLDPLGLKAFDMDGRPLDVKREGDFWTIENSGRDFTFSYEVVLTIEDRYAAEVRGMISLLEEDRGRIMGRDVFLIPAIRFGDGVTLDVSLGHEGPVHSTWECIDSRLIVPGVVDLATTLVVSGDYRVYETEVYGTRLTFAIAGKWSFSDDELFSVIRDVVSHEIGWFGSSTHKKHLFVCDTNPVKGGKGFDHYGVHFSGSILLLLDRRIDRSQIYDTPMSIVAHEFFHNWNGEAIRPASDGMMWFIEGATVYYSYRALTDINILTSLQYDMRMKLIRQRFMDNPYLESVSISSAANRDLSDKDMVNMLYDGGFLAAGIIDEKIAELSGGRKGLIDVIRYLRDSNPDGCLLDEDKLCEALIQVTGHDFKAFMGELVDTPAPLAIVSSEVSS
ncbi:MAG: hypothetical protein KAV42_01690 [Candidatus Krumholzibacteria bacterium]|nr:hypothetical protein [Candidatus Krumholzibacteria bacterium]